MGLLPQFRLLLLWSSLKISCQPIYVRHTRFWVKAVRVQCGVLVVGQSDLPGLQVSVPVLGAVVGPWEEMEGHRHPVHLEPHGSQESGSLLLQPPTLRELFHRWSGPPLSVMSLR